MRMKVLVLVLASIVAMSLSGICPFPGDERLESKGLVAEFRGGILVNLAADSFDSLKSLEIAINRKKFVPESWEVRENALVVKGRAGNLDAEVLYTALEGEIDIEVKANGKIFEVRFLVEPCDFETLVIKGVGEQYIQGRHVAYGFILDGSRSIFTAGKLVILTRKTSGGVKMRIIVDESVQRIKERLGKLKSAKVLKVVDQDGNALGGVYVVESVDGKVLSVARADKDGKLEITVGEGAEFSLLWGEDYEVLGFDGKVLKIRVPDQGWRWEPYIAGSDEDGAWVAFRTWRPTKAVVKLDGKSFTDGLIDTFHMIRVEGEGEAKVIAGDLMGEVEVRPLRIRKFLVYGDTRTNEDWHEMVCRAMAEEGADFVIHTGDLVESGDLMKDWDKFFRASHPLYSKTPLFPTLGNHERNSPIYYQAFELRRGGGDYDKRWYSYSIGDVYFIVLDSNVAEGTNVYRAQTEWLKEELEKAQSYRFRVVYFHHPFFTNSPNREPTLKEEWKELFEKYGVQLVLNGHIHHYERFLINGVTYVTTGGGGAPLGFGLMSASRKDLPGTMAGRAGYLHYVVAEVGQKGIKFTVKAVAKYDWGKIDTSVKGETIDEFFIPYE